jgi:hypothetical protein
VKVLKKRGFAVATVTAKINHREIDFSLGTASRPFYSTASPFSITLPRAEIIVLKGITPGAEVYLFSFALVQPLTGPLVNFSEPYFFYCLIFRISDNCFAKSIPTA